MFPCEASQPLLGKTNVQDELILVRDVEQKIQALDPQRDYPLTRHDYESSSLRSIFRAIFDGFRAHEIITVASENGINSHGMEICICILVATH